MSGGGSNTVSTSVPSQFVPYYQEAMGQGQNLMETGGPQYYPGQQVAPLNPLQESGLTGVAQTASGVDPSAVAANTNAFMTSGALMNPSMNPYLQGTYQQAANQVQNTLSSEFAGSGRNIIGSAPVQSDELNNLATQLYGGAYSQGVNATNTASALAPSIQQGTYLPSQELLSAGSGLQGQTQNLINANMNEWNYNQQLPYNTLSWYSSLLGQNSSPFSSQSSSSTGNPWQTGLGAASTAAGLYGSLAGTAVPDTAALTASTLADSAAWGDAATAAAAAASDVRVKEGIRHLGALSDGTPFYTFRYRGDPVVHMGVMAQEVEGRYPDVVTENAAGIKHVHYGLLADRVAEGQMPMRQAQALAAFVR